MQIDDAVELMQLEYVGFPGLKLTFWQAQRLWRLSEADCAAALQRLVDSRFLTRSVNGLYTRTGWVATLVAPPVPPPSHSAGA